MTPIAFFGRAYQLSIDTQDGQHLVVRSLVSPGETPLRVSFDIHTYMMPTAYWDANFTIWNLNRAGSSLGGALPVGQGSADSLGYNQRITAGDAVAFSAGYDNAGTGQQSFSADNSFLWAGSVFQPVWTRVNVVDFKLTLRCLYGLMQESLNLIDFSMYGDSPTYYDTLGRLCTECDVAMDAAANAQERLQKLQYMRGFRELAKPGDIVRRIMNDSSLFAWVTPPAPNSKGQKSTLHVRSFDVAPTKPDIAYQPPNLPPSPFTLTSNVKPTLLGVPDQMSTSGGPSIGVTQNGVIFRVLLDPEVRIGMVVQLVAGTVINKYQFNPFGGYPALPSRNALYMVAGVRHVGDSRGTGDDWYTEITGVLWQFFDAYMKMLTPSSKTPS